QEGSREKVWSLREALFQRLKEERESLRLDLDELLATAQRNESLLAKFGELEHLVLSADRLDRLASTLVKELARRFDLVAVHLALLPPSKDIPTLEEDPHFSWVGPEVESQFPEGSSRPLVRDSLPSGSTSFFPPSLAGQVRSEALVPLRWAGRFLGVLCLGSADPSHYRPGLSTHLLERLAAKVAWAVDRVQVFEQLRYLASTDELTGLFNQRHFYQSLDGEFSRARRYGYPLACIALDLDDFKSINDQWGHLAGDQVLREVSELIRANMRKADLAFRYGGEEFILLLPHADAPHAFQAASKLWQRISSKGIALEGGRVKLSASLGVASLPSPEIEAAADLFKAADLALLQAKREGKNRVALFEGSGAD
ncbi:MAG: DUF484 family protein, partial [Nitrospinota bacterium]